VSRASAFRKLARRGATDPLRIPASTRLALADAVDQAIAESYPWIKPEIGCLYRAAILLPVLRRLTNSNAWFVDGGAFIADLGHGETIGFSPSSGSKFEGHAWLVCNRPRGEDIIVDPTTRHLSAIAMQHGRTWTRYTPSVAWHTPSDLASIGFEYVSDGYTANQARREVGVISLGIGPSVERVFAAVRCRNQERAREVHADASQ
jgi:hypothetical protein